MSTVSDILRTKGDHVLTIEPDATVLEAARLMNVHRVGALVVVEPAASVDSGEPTAIVGIITERDLLVRIVAAEADPAGTTVGRVMTSPVMTCSPQTTLEELRQAMRQRRVRHMPVTCEHGLCGMISIGDLNLAQTHVLEETVRYLETYMYHG